jgi:hypothetical protein
MKPIVAWQIGLPKVQIQFLRVFEIAAVMALFVAISVGVSRLVFRLTGSPPPAVK